MHILHAFIYNLLYGKCILCETKDRKNKNILCTKEYDVSLPKIHISLSQVSLLNAQNDLAQHSEEMLVLWPCQHKKMQKLCESI